MLTTLVDEVTCHCSPSTGMTVEFDNTLLTVREDVRALSVCLVKTGEATIESTVDVFACNKSLLNHLPATDGEDYSRYSLTQTITFAPKETRKCFFEVITDDEVVETSEVFGACVRAESAFTEIGLNDSITVVIVDNDGERVGGRGGGTLHYI